MFQIEKVIQIAGQENVSFDEPLSKHTTFRIGGNATYFVTPETVESLVEVIQYVRKEQFPYFILGNGSNLLAYDTGYDGMIIATHKTGNDKGQEKDENSMPLDLLEELPAGDAGRSKVEKYLSDTESCRDKTLVLAGSGIMLSVMANTIGKHGLAGFEFASGIPGTLGGAVTMNAGAYGGEIKDCILGAMALLPDGTQHFYEAEELELGYRTSIIQTKELVVLWAVFAFEKGDANQIEAIMQELNQKRREKQPLQYGSAGSTFKRPEGMFAGKLIEDAGLKGYRVGDVMVSTKHCGFVVNVGNGTYEQAKQVIEHVQKTVQEKFGVWLEMEVRTIS
ncbi:MAG: UDP-N-acetylmuramate dehydrogenase [Butyribacter sp.]|nr:UDP-N-acetylmuramate dehydrogenase [bacterium]MDY3853729.1 UDP-N-acetylmuramate dehydrogenase [Butyribacter sp.]